MYRVIVTFHRAIKEKEENNRLIKAKSYRKSKIKYYIVFYDFNFRIFFPNYLTTLRSNALCV